MATTINTYSVGLTLNAADYINKAALSATESRRLTRAIEAARDPSEKFTLAQERLTKALEKGGISHGVYNRLLDAERAKLERATRAAKDHERAVGGLIDKNTKAGRAATALAETARSFRTNPAFLATAGAVAAVTAAATAAVAALRDAHTEIDKQAKAAARLGMSYRELMGLQHAAGEIAGASAETVVDAFKDLNLRVAKAAQGNQTIQKAFARIGIDAGKALEGGPLEAVKRIAGGFDGLATHAEKLGIANQLFGENGTKIVAMLTSGRDVLEESIEFQQKWNGLTDAQVMGVEAANDAMARLHTAGQGFANMIAADMAPLFEIMANDTLAMADSFERMGSFTKGMAESIAMGAGDLQDYWEVFSLLSDLPKKTWQLDFSGAADVIDKAFTFDKGPQKYMELLQRRGELEFDAANKATEREQQRAAMIAEATGEAGGLTSEYEKQLAALENQAAAIAFGEAAAKRMRLEAQGYSDEQIKRLESQQQMLESFKNIKAFDQHLETLRLQTIELKHGKDAADRLRLAAKGFSDEQIKQIENQQQLNADLQLMGRAIQAAGEHFEKERQRDMKMREEISKGPGAGMEVGSAEAVKFLADQQNAAIGAAAVPERPTPGEEAVRKEVERQLKILQEQMTEQKRQTELSRQILDELRENGFAGVG